MGFENVGEIQVNKTGKSLVIHVMNDKPIAQGETLYVDLDNIRRVIERKMRYTSVARRA
jgi:hypothetical protein